MKNKLIKVFSIVFIAAACVLALLGCNGNKPKYDYLVTFNYNVESYGITEKFENQYLGVFKDDLIMAPVKSDNKDYYNNSKFKERKIPHYIVEGWWLAQTDDAGNPLKDEDGKIIFDRKWDFGVDKVNSAITLYAELSRKSVVNLIYDDEVKRSPSFDPGRSVSELSVSPSKPKSEGKTFYGYYYDSEFTQPCTFPFIIGDEDIDIYAKFIDGDNFTIVKTEKEFYDALFGDKKIYLDADLDFADFNFTRITEYGHELAGNGHTVSNITALIKSEINNTLNLGLFGRLTKEANIHDITFENTNVTIETVKDDQPGAAALFAWQIVQGAKLENLTITGSITWINPDSKNSISLYALSTNGYVASDTVDYSQVQIINNKAENAQ